MGLRIKFFIRLILWFLVALAGAYLVVKYNAPDYVKIAVGLFAGIWLKDLVREYHDAQH